MTVRHAGELRTTFLDRIKQRDQGNTRIAVAAPSRHRWRRMTALALPRCPDCRSLVSSGGNEARDMVAHDSWHDKLEDLLSHVLERLDRLDSQFAHILARLDRLDTVAVWGL